jgi:formiminotetrahydrofolate cyclodeaminase
MLLAKITKDAKLNNVRINLNDPNDKEFMEDATMHEMAMKQDAMSDEESMPELPAQEGLMTRPEIGV